MFDRNLWHKAMDSRWLLLLTILFSGALGVLIVQEAGVLSRIIEAVYLQGAGLQAVRPLLILLLGYILLRTAFVWGRDVAAQSVALRVKRALRHELLAQLNALGPGYTQGERTGELANTAVAGVESLDAYFSQYLPQLFVAALVPLTILFFVLPIDWLSALVMALTAPLIPAFMVLIGRLAERATRRQWRALSLMSAHFLDVLQGLRTLKELGQSRAQVRNIERVSEEFRATTLLVLRVAFLSALALELLATLSTALVAVEIGLRLLYGRIPFQQALFVLILAPEFYQPLRTLGARFHAGMEGTSAARRIFDILNLPIEPEPQTAPPQPLERVVVDDVWLTYRGESRPALEGVSLELRRGQTLALVGASGAGKSSVANLLLRFAEPRRGQIRVNGRDLATINPDQWRAQIAYVPQAPYLFHDTISANIRLGQPDASHDDVVWAAQQAHIHDFISSLPQGYDTPVGEQGARLSAGQAQRIALARAFLKRDAPLLVLDEPTSNLDPDTELQLHEATRRLLAQDRTVLIIAHRLSTVMDADEIVVLSRGKVVERGTHAELRARAGAYERMLRAGRDVDVPESPPRVLHPDAPLPTGVDTTPLPDTSPRAPEWGQRALLRRLMGFVRPYWRRVTLSVLLGALTILSSIGLMTTSSFLISRAALAPSIADLQVAIVGVRFFGIARGVLRYLERLVTHGVTFGVLARLRVWFYARIEPLAPARLQALRSADLLSRIVSDVDALEHFYVRVVAPPLTAIVTAAIWAWYLGLFSPVLTTVYLLFMLLAGAALPWFTLVTSRRAAASLVGLRARLQEQLVDVVQGMADLQAFGQSGRLAARVDATSRALAGAQQGLAWVSGSHAALGTLLMHLSMWAVLALAIPLVGDGRIDGVYLAGLALATLAAFEAVQTLPLAAQYLETSRRAAQRLFELVDAPLPVSVPADLQPVPPRPTVTLDDITFAYEPGEAPALHELDLSLTPGKRVAIVGPSGAGKSSISNLLLRFWEYNAGDMRLDGRSVRACDPDDVRRLYSVIGQNTYLFNTTMRENIQIARPDADDAELVEAAHQAELHDFVARLPDGYATRIGERGLQLSGGERQRLALARALLSQAPVLILDEPTANLDPVTERRVLRTLYAQAPTRTLLLITHRLVEMERLDEIVVLDNGRVIQRGTHAQLLREPGLYQRLWHLQNRALLADGWESPAEGV